MPISSPVYAPDAVLAVSPEASAKFSNIDVTPPSDASDKNPLSFKFANFETIGRIAGRTEAAWAPILRNPPTSGIPSNKPPRSETIGDTIFDGET